MINANCLNNELSTITWDRIHIFLPNFKNEILEAEQPPISPTQLVANLTMPLQQPNVPTSLNLQQNFQEEQPKLSSPVSEQASSG